MPLRLQQILAAGVLVGLAGLLTMVTMIMSECYRFNLRCLITDIEFLFPAFAGALISGMVFFALWGRNGPAGWGYAGLGAVLCTGLGAMLTAGVLAMITGSLVHFDDLFLFLIGPWIVVITFGDHPATILIWLGIMSAVHLILRQIFQKRSEERRVGKEC